MDGPVKDLDVFCRAGDYPRILNFNLALDPRPSHGGNA
jgi:hypothetical protein